MLGKQDHRAFEEIVIQEWLRDQYPATGRADVVCLDPEYIVYVLHAVMKLAGDDLLRTFDF
jgi:hypothetical protein